MDGGTGKQYLEEQTHDQEWWQSSLSEAETEAETEAEAEAKREVGENCEELKLREDK